LWAGLGYYRRARQLHQAAQQIVEQHDGVFPSEPAQVLALPGIGRYTGNAILTFADDAKLPIVEANTQRLYSRLLRWKSEISAKESQSALWGFAEAILPKKSGSGQLNQAMMEIGSQLCLPKRPTCLLCPLQTICPTFEHGEQHLIPAPKLRKEYTDLNEAAVVIRDAKGRYLMRRCASDERWAGLWDFPRFDTTLCKSQASVRSSLSRQFAERFGSQLHVGNELHQLKHAVTRYRITLTSFEAVLDASETKFSAGKVEIIWCNLAQMEKLAMNASCTRLWNWLKKRSEK
jgi:A/G-specific adenine glycosylase